MPYPTRDGWLLGIDASIFQGILDFESLKAAGLGFVILKATEGVNYVDPVFYKNSANAKAAGVPCAAYHFFKPQRDPKQQARDFFAAAGRRTTLRPAMDWETFGGLSASLAVDAAETFLEETEKLWGVRPIIYTYSAMIEKLAYAAAPLKVTAMSVGSELWVANWTKASQPWVPHPWKATDCVLWQFDGDGGLKLPNGVDADFNWFMGDAARLQAVLGYTPPAAPSVTPPATVKELQQDLLKLGFKLPIFGADGFYGKETAGAIRAFQVAAGLPQDGLDTLQLRKAVAETLARLAGG